MNKRNDERAKADYQDPVSWVILILIIIINGYNVIQSARALDLAEAVSARALHVHQPHGGE